MPPKIWNSGGTPVEPDYSGGAGAGTGAEKVSYITITNPALALYAAEGAGIAGSQATDGATLVEGTGFTLDRTDGYDTFDFECMPPTPSVGTGMPATDAVVDVRIRQGWNATGQVTLIPVWCQHANALNAAIAAVAAGALTCRIKVTQKDLT